MKLEIGMIARTNKGLLIDIIHDFDSKLCAYKRDEISKASFHLIDLIEVGDYVNGARVIELKPFNGDYDLKLDVDGYDGSGGQCIKQNEVEEILTREQYEANRYKVVE